MVHELLITNVNYHFLYFVTIKQMKLCSALIVRFILNFIKKKKQQSVCIFSMWLVIIVYQFYSYLWFVRSHLFLFSAWTVRQILEGLIRRYVIRLQRSIAKYHRMRTSHLITWTSLVWSSACAAWCCDWNGVPGQLFIVPASVLQILELMMIPNRFSVVLCCQFLRW